MCLWVSLLVAWEAKCCTGWQVEARREVGEDSRQAFSLRTGVLHSTGALLSKVSLLCPNICLLCHNHTLLRVLEGRMVLHVDVSVEKAYREKSWLRSW